MTNVMNQQSEFEKYGLMLEKLGMLKATERGSDRLYTITEKGREFLADFRQLDEETSGSKRRVLAELLQR